MSASPRFPKEQDAAAITTPIPERDVGTPAGCALTRIHDDKSYTTDSTSPKTTASNVGEIRDQQYHQLDPDELKPYSKKAINQRSRIITVEGKGRCLATRAKVMPGEIIFIEEPVVVAVPSLDRGLWDRLEAMNEQTPFEMPPIWHLAAIYTLFGSCRDKRAIVEDKWVPDDADRPSADTIRVMACIRELVPHPGLSGEDHNDVPQSRYERTLQAWRYNSFGHHTHPDGIIIYDRISMMAHSCDASACWHFGPDETFVLRARKQLYKGDEITISYIGEEDLLKATHLRREKLESWRFICCCRRCTDLQDFARGMRCLNCGIGTVFFKTDDKSVTTTRCNACEAETTENDVAECLHLEAAYSERLEAMSADDLEDTENVYREAQRLFTQHWVLYTIDTMLFEAHRKLDRVADAACHQESRIRYAHTVVPRASYGNAWLLEELADILAASYHPDLPLRSWNGDEEQLDVLFKASGTLNMHRRNLLTKLYEKTVLILIVLCGDTHEYTLSAHRKYKVAALEKD